MLDNDITKRHHKDRNRATEIFKIRNILNIIFMVGALTGVFFYLYGSTVVGIIIILASIVFKLVECCLRFIH